MVRKITQTDIRDTLKRFDAYVPSPAVPYSPRAIVRAMKLNGEKDEVIRAELGVSNGSLWRWTRDLDVPPDKRNWGWVPKQLRSKNKNMSERGVPLSERKRLLLSGECDRDRRRRA